MIPDTIVRVINSGPNGIRSCWFKDVPQGITEDHLKYKMQEIFTTVYEDWDFDWMLEMPCTATAIYNWANC